MSAEPLGSMQGRQPMLFGDPLEGRDGDDVGYRGPVACAAVGITYRQLDYWARTGLLQPSVRAAKGSGSQRLYSFKDILVLKIVKKLLDAGVSLQQVRTAVTQLHRRGVDDLASTSAPRRMKSLTFSKAVKVCLESLLVAFGVSSKVLWLSFPASALKKTFLLTNSLLVVQ